jgi:hypothetical protein
MNADDCAICGEPHTAALEAALAVDDIDRAVALGLLEFAPIGTPCPECAARVAAILAARDERLRALAARERHRARTRRLAERAEARARRRAAAAPAATQAGTVAPALPPAAAAALARAKAKAAGKRSD